MTTIMVSRELLQFEQGYDNFKNEVATTAEGVAAYVADALTGDDPFRSIGQLGELVRFLTERRDEAARWCLEHGASFADVAGWVGMSKQAAWQKYRQVDDTARPAQPTPAPSRPRGKRRPLEPIYDVERRVGKPTPGLGQARPDGS